MMKCLVAHETRRTKDAVSRREEEITAEALRFGRGAENEVYLPDPRVTLQFARLRRVGDRLVIQAEGTADLRVNGVVLRTASVSPGDTIGLGPYEITIDEPPEGADTAITVRLVEPLGDDLQQLLARSQTGLAATRLSKRMWSWALFLGIFAVFLALPIAAFFLRGTDEAVSPMLLEAEKPPDSGEPRRWLPIRFDSPWISGEISAPHKFIAKDCNLCHQKAFVQVPNEACLACHKDVGQHADPVKFPLATLVQVRCQQCHKEHEGPKPIIRADQALCVACHGDLKRQAAKTTLIDTADFERHHPDFRPNVMVDPWTRTTKRIGLNAQPREMSNVRFSHKKHLVANGVRSPKGKQKLGCGDCHQPAPGGAGMKPIDMESHCQACHALDFEKNAPSLPHRRPEAVEATIRGYYSALAIRGGVTDADAPPAVRRRAGTPLPVTTTKDVLAWVNKRTSKGVAFAFSKARCGFCHEVRKDGAGSAGGAPGGTKWRIKALVTDRWLVKGNFDHASHTAVTCMGCHKATTSDISADVLLPPLASCQGCHGGETATAKVPSTCILCHDFHLSGQGRM